MAAELVAAGVELVSLMIIVFGVVFGAVRGLLCTAVFLIVRGLIFPYVFPNILVDYAVYFPVLSLVSGVYGIFFNGAYDRKIEADMLAGEEKNPLKRRLSRNLVFLFIGLCLLAFAITPCFTLLDNLVYPAVAGLGERSAKAYFYSSLPTLVMHTVSVTLSVAVLFFPLYKVMKFIKRGAHV